MTTPLLSVRDLRVSFAAPQSKKWPWSPAKRVNAVNGVSFDLPAGKTLGVVGESGCGKSTLVRAIAGLYPPTSGDVTFDGKPVDYTNRRETNALRSRMQMIFQDPIASLNPRMNIREIVTEPLRVFRPDMTAQAQKEAVRAMLDRVGIAERNFNRYPHEFSGGQCQRIGIARALVTEPDILLCDEPVSALDVSIQAQVINILKELQKDMGLTLVFVAHDLGVVRHISDEILVMYMGGVMEHAPAADLVAAPQHPYTKALFSAVPVPDPKVTTTPEVLDGDLPSPLDLPEGCLFQSRCPRRMSRCATTRPALRHVGQSKVACLLYEPEPAAI
ncbi:oligopeptide/dipeptide ABC transporter ATP-binding protein [Celeribacter arenosi]|uniref:Murein tripeptide/oligopeptide ABC transporter ATP binding protein OppF n=1 Tax=Celeribacter arenosi TaxID=792649 RepID=A0ABP7K7R8_9RHOB